MPGASGAFQQAGGNATAGDRGRIAAGGWRGWATVFVGALWAMSLVVGAISVASGGVSVDSSGTESGGVGRWVWAGCLFAAGHLVFSSMVGGRCFPVAGRSVVRSVDACVLGLLVAGLVWQGAMLVGR